MTIDSLITEEFRLAEPQKKALQKMGIKTAYDLLCHFPARYGDTSSIKRIEDIKKDDNAVIFGKISNLKVSKAFIKKIPMGEGILEDETGKIKIVWFHQPYLAKMIRNGQFVRVEGKVSGRKGEPYITNPKIEKVDVMPEASNSIFGSSAENHTLYPVYPESQGISSNWIYHAVQKIMARGILDGIEDIIPENILQKYNLPDIRTALIWIHAPKKEGQALAARKRFAFEEIFFIQIQKTRERKLWREKSAWKIETKQKDIADFIATLPFKPTKSQLEAIKKITLDFRRGWPMARLLEGDVGSGKTAVAAATIYSVTKNYLQTAYMCPTEILAKQQYENFIAFFRHLPIKIGLITGSEAKIFPSKTDPAKPTKISRPQLLKWISEGIVPIVIGTHALIQRSVNWKQLAFAVIDEQHRFGTFQRQKLTMSDSKMPHLLSMTATPIPRTLALTMYGDLDLTVLEGMPAGRKPIISTIVLPSGRNKTYQQIRKELDAGRQLYVICPRINEPDPDKEMAIAAKSVTAEAGRLAKEVFPQFSIAILHSKMTPAEKEKVMNDFAGGGTKILVATSVVEVGVNVPNATMIIIEGAERFGLAQLHQIRGRVIRSNHQAYCYIFTESNSQKTRERLKALTTAKNGFELAEFDLAQRGAGELYGRRQSGLSDLAMIALQNIKMVEFAREEAAKIIETDPELTSYPAIKKHIESNTQAIHFE